MKVLLCAALAAMVLSTGAALAKGGESNLAYQLQQQRESHLIAGVSSNGDATVLLADAGGGDGGEQPRYA